MGLGLPGFVPGSADKKLLCDAMRQSEETLIEQAMLEDKVKATDWEATNEAIEEQVARESYLEWLRENDRRNRQPRAGHSAATSSANAELRSPRLSSSGAPSSARNSPKLSYVEQRKSPNASPKASGSRDGMAPSPLASPAAGTSSASTSKQDWGLGPGFELAETASFLGQLPPDMFGKEPSAQRITHRVDMLDVFQNRTSRLGRRWPLGSGAGRIAAGISRQSKKES